MSVEVTCPLVGLKGDPSLRYGYPHESHRCYALPDDAQFIPDAEHQVRYCLSSAHTSCPYFRPEGASPVAGEPAKPIPKAKRGARLRWVLWGSVGILLLLALWQLLSVLAPPKLASVAPPAALTVTPLPTPATAVPWPTPPPASALVINAQPTSAAPQPTTPVPTLATDEVRLEITPAANAVGWVGSSEPRGNHFGDSYLHAGVFDGEVVHSALQFDLSRVQRGAPIRSAVLELTGLDDSRLNPEGNGVWEVRWLAPEINEDWSRRNFQDVHNAPVLQALAPPVGQAELAPSAVQRFEFSPEQLNLLAKALVDEQSLIAFRLDGPETGANNLFSWDTGSGPATLGNTPKLIIVTGPPPPTPPAIPTRDYIVVTSTPTPENVLTAAAIVQTATAFATMIGTPAPTPRSMVTATPTPANEATAQAERLLAGLPPVIVPTPPPANEATATAIALLATAQALTTGTWTPTPSDAVTATPTPTFVVVTNTPTPASPAERLAAAFAEATRTVVAGPPPPLPPAVITATPTSTRPPEPQNAETAEAQAAQATIIALFSGASAPQAPATPAPPPTATSLPTVAPASAVTAGLKDKIVFRSDRLGPPRLFVLDSRCVQQAEECPEASLLPLADLPAYLAYVSRRGVSTASGERLFLRPDLYRRPQVFVQDTGDGSIRRLVDLRGAMADPEWSPAGDTIALASDEPGNDEIFLVAADGSNLRRLTWNTWEWDRHPTWSPDGQQLLFYSNRGEGRRQLWVMNADGSGLRNVSNNEFNDWDPVWIK